jgi:hypothetical protein
MADKVAGVPLAKTVEHTVNNGAKAAPKAAEGNPAFRMMGMSPTRPSLELCHTRLFKGNMRKGTITDLRGT